MHDAALVVAYLRTTYWVAARPRPIGLRIGASEPRLCRLLARFGSRTWSIVTAWNPRSRTAPAWRNARYQKELTSWLRRRRLPWLPAVGEGDDAGWPPEPSVFVPGMTVPLARACGRRFRQNAVVVGGCGGRPRLLWCERVGSGAPRAATEHSACAIAQS